MTVTCQAGLSTTQIESIVADDGIGTEAAKRAVRRFLGKPGRFDDDRGVIIQEIRIHIWHKLSRRNTAPPNIEAWVRTTAKHKALDLLGNRKNEVLRQALVRKALGQRDDPSHLEIDPNEFEGALSGLPDDLRMVCDEILDGKTPHAVASVLGISPGRVRRRLNDLRKPFLEIYETAKQGEERVRRLSRDTGNHRRA